MNLRGLIRCLIRSFNRGCSLLVALILTCSVATAEDLTLQQIYDVLELVPNVAVDQEVGPLVKQYSKAKDHKAIALAYDIGGGYSVGMAYEAETEFVAAALATQYCNAQREKHKVVAPCEVIALKSQLIRTGNSLKKGITGDTPAMAWRVDGPNSTLYLIGTIHVLKSTLLPLPQVFDQIFDASDQIFFETNPILLTDPERQAAMSKFLSANPKEVKAAFSRADKKMLKRFTKKTGLSYESAFAAMPVLSAMQISQLHMSALGYAFDTGVEMHYARQASTLGKRISELESPEVPLVAMVDYPLEVQAQALIDTIENLNLAQLSIETILRSWLEGSAESVYQTTRAEMEQNEEINSLVERLLDDRNQAWMVHLEQALEQESTTVVMAGAAHFGGPQGVLALLRKRGYEPIQLTRVGDDVLSKK